MDLLIAAVKDIGPVAFQAWQDKRGWLVFGGSDDNYRLQVWIYDTYATISPQGFGSTEALIAKTPEELIECCNIWWRNR